MSDTEALREIISQCHNLPRSATADRIVTLAESLLSSPPPPQGREETLEEAAKVADAEAEREGKLAQQYVRSKWLFAEHKTAWRSADRIAASIRALKSVPPSVEEDGAVKAARRIESNNEPYTAATLSRDAMMEQ